MSQNYFQIDNHVILMGWDRMQQQAFYALFKFANPPAYTWDPLLLEIDYPFDRIENIQFVDEIVSAMKSKLSRFGLSAPKRYLTPLIADITDDVGNVGRIHFETKSLSLLIQTPFLMVYLFKLHRLTPLSVTQFSKPNPFQSRISSLKAIKLLLRLLICFYTPQLHPTTPNPVIWGVLFA